MSDRQRVTNANLSEKLAVQTEILKRVETTVITTDVRLDGHEHRISALETGAATDKAKVSAVCASIEAIQQDEDDKAKAAANNRWLLVLCVISILGNWIASIYQVSKH